MTKLTHRNKNIEAIEWIRRKVDRVLERYECVGSVEVRKSQSVSGQAILISF